MARSPAPLWQGGIPGNLRLLGVVLASFVLQLAIHYAPALQQVFGAGPLGFGEALGWIVLGLVPLVVGEIRKSLVSRTEPAL